MDSKNIPDRKIKTILLVDDDPINNYLNERILNKMEIADEIRVVTNGEDGIKCLHDHCFKSRIAPEIILLDINMPIMDGFEFLKTFNDLDFKNKDKVTIAVLSSSASHIDKDKMTRLGIEHYLTKPLTEDMVTNFLDKINVIY